MFTYTHPQPFAGSPNITITVDAGEPVMNYTYWNAVAGDMPPLARFTFTDALGILGWNPTSTVVVTVGSVWDGSGAATDEATATVTCTPAPAPSGSVELVSGGGWLLRINDMLPTTLNGPVNIPATVKAWGYDETAQEWSILLGSWTTYEVTSDFSQGVHKLTLVGGLGESESGVQVGDHFTLTIDGSTDPILEALVTS